MFRCYVCGNTEGRTKVANEAFDISIILSHQEMRTGSPGDRRRRSDRRNRPRRRGSMRRALQATPFPVHATGP